MNERYTYMQYLPSLYVIHLTCYKSFFQLDHRIDISLYLKQPIALHYSNEANLFNTIFM